MEAEIESLIRNEEMSSVLVKDMQKQIDKYAHSRSELEVLHSALMHAQHSKEQPFTASHADL